MTLIVQNIYTLAIYIYIIATSLHTRILCPSVLYSVQAMSAQYVNYNTIHFTV